MAAKSSITEPIRIEFSNELLCPSELFQARSRSHRIPIKGEKDFCPNDTEQQRVCLQKTFNEHWLLVAEERVERIGNLVIAEWIPKERIVKLLSPAGKFWQTMGFSDRGNQCLFPEEALYLMECVFAHLKRLGYVVNRFDSRHYKQEVTTSRNTRAAAGQTKTTQPSQDEHINSEVDSANKPDRNWWMDVLSKSRPTSNQPSVPRWDFRCIVFPDLGSCSGNHAFLASPDPSLLPGALWVPRCHMVPWQKKINLKGDCLSRKEQQREHNQMHCNINDNGEVSSCKNWAEYSELVTNTKSQQCRERPAHRWEQITPLTQPGQCSSHSILLKQVGLIQSSGLLEEASSHIRLPHSGEMRISFNVYQSDTVAEFKKSQPGKPYTCMCVCSFDNPVPDLIDMKQLFFQSKDVAVTFAVVDHGDISFYCFRDFKLPAYVY
ncbi:tRNA-splicing endonuclease subunit Sen54 isoform X2 [Trichomycterus rosablanca]|uniref:tRNA-splicing endonuclease subunit Sen54 isoform X2 n=1 Tax=Trichomycterus rosablanca TaxID=2290929 RepID=UPI002F353421